MAVAGMKAKTRSPQQKKIEEKLGCVFSPALMFCSLLKLFFTQQGAIFSISVCGKKKNILPKVLNSRPIRVGRTSNGSKFGNLKLILVQKTHLHSQGPQKNFRRHIHAMQDGKKIHGASLWLAEPSGLGSSVAFWLSVDPNWAARTVFSPAFWLWMDGRFRWKDAL